jgi:NDP-sugar pyrophosphorylase family protein
MKAMILAAGLGTRLKPLTDTRPKALVEVGGVTLLELTIRYLKKFGVDELVINLHHFPNQIKDFLRSKNNFQLSKIEFSDESQELLDTGGAIKKAAHLLRGPGPFILIGIDVMTNLDLGSMLAFHKEQKALVTLAVKDRETSRSLLFDKNMHLTGWKHNETGEIKGEKASLAAFSLGFSVVHIIDPAFLDLIQEEGKFSILDPYLRLMYDQPIVGYRHDESIWLEFGRTSRLLEQPETPEFKKLLRFINI